MAIFYVDSTAGSNTAPYDTWAKAATTFKSVWELASGSGGPVGGDRILVHYQHADGHAIATTITCPNLLRGLGLRVISVDKANDKYRKMSTNGYIGTTSGNFTIAITNTVPAVEFRGVTFKATGGVLGLTNGGNGGSRIRIDDCDVRSARYFSGVVGQGMVRLRKCYFDLENYSSSTIGAIWGLVSGLTKLIQCSFENVDSTRSLYGSSSNIGPCRIEVEACDLSAFSTLVEYQTSNVVGGVNAFFSHCKLNGSVTIAGSNASSLSSGPYVIRLENCESGTPDRQARGYSGIHAKSGSIVHDESVVRTGGANDGRVAYSLLMTPDSSYCSPANPIWTDIPIVKWLSAGSQTITIHFRSASNPSITDEMVWMELLTPDEDGTSDTAYHFNTTRATYGNGATISTAGTGWTGGTQYLLSKTVAPDVPGPAYVRVFCADKDMGPINLDPRIEVV